MYNPSVSGHRHLNDTSVFMQKSHLPQLNWCGPVFHIRGALQQSSMRVCICLCGCVFVYVSLCVGLCVCVRSHFCIVSVVWCVRGTQAHSGESIWDIYYALHQSFWTLDISLAEQIVSYQNSISEMTCRNSLPYPPPNLSSTLAHSSSLPAYTSLHLPTCYHTEFSSTPAQTYTRAQSCTCTLERTNEVQSPPPSTPSHLPLSLK